MAKCFRFLSLFFLWISLTQPVMAASNSPDVTDWAENELLQSLRAIKSLHSDLALQKLSDLTHAVPRYRLAKLMQADLLAIKAGHYDWVMTQRHKHRVLSQSLISEALVRWQGESKNGGALLQQYVLKSNDAPYVVIVNTFLHRLYLFKHTEDGFKEVANYYISIGRKGVGKHAKGDLKTPIGIYQVVKQLDDDQLPELYGVAALTLDYPNSWDKQQGRTGSGIWMHGTPRTTFSRPPMASKGCVVLNNPQMASLVDDYQLPASTPVVIVDKPMKASEEAGEENTQVLSKIQQWLATRHTAVDWRSVSVYRYPGETGVYWVNYTDQHQAQVEEYWQKKQNQWQLVLQKTSPAPIRNLASAL